MKDESRVRSRLNVLLAERHVTKRELAKMAGVTPATVWRWSTDEGMGRSRLDTLVQVSDALGCPLQSLFDVVPVGEGA